GSRRRPGGRRADGVVGGFERVAGPAERGGGAAAEGPARPDRYVEAAGETATTRGRDPARDRGRAVRQEAMAATCGQVAQTLAGVVRQAGRGDGRPAR